MAETKSVIALRCWEINCGACNRSSWDGLPSDEYGDRCPFCGQFPAKEDDYGD